MQSAIDQFRTNIQRVRDLISLYISLKSQSTSALDLSDLLRAALVLAVSALDYYVHEITRIGMLEIHRGDRPEPSGKNTGESAFSRFKVSLGNAREERNLAINIGDWLEFELLQNSNNDFVHQAHHLAEFIPFISQSLSNKLNSSTWLDNEIRKLHSYKSFQTPENIAEAIRLISDKSLWKEVGNFLGKPTDLEVKAIKQELNAIVDRRNKIAHEADIDPTFNVDDRWPINEHLVNNAVTFIERVVEAIHNIL